MKLELIPIIANKAPCKQGNEFTANTQLKATAQAAKAKQEVARK